MHRIRISPGGIRSRAKRAAVAVAMVVGLGLPAGTLAAGAPLVVHDEIDSTVQLALLSGACGFDVYSHLKGSVTSVVHFDADGNPDSEVTTGLVKRTLFSPTTGQSVTFALNLSSIVDYAPDGSAVVMDAGTFINIHVAGGEPLRFVAGRDLYTAIIVDVTPEGVPIVGPVDFLAFSGTDRGTLLAICDALAG